MTAQFVPVPTPSALHQPHRYHPDSTPPARAYTTTIQPTSMDGRPVGAPALLAEPAEPCDTETTVHGAVVLSLTDAWEQALTDPTVAGERFLLRGGIYQATDKLWLRAGQPDRPLLIKPYNCEAVTIRGSLRPNSYTVIAGIRLEATGIEDTKWAMRIDGKNAGPLQNIVVRHNTIYGGTIDALRVNDDVRDVIIEGNHIDGGRDGHDLFLTTTPTEEETTAEDTAEATTISTTLVTPTTPAAVTTPVTTNTPHNAIPMPDEILITENRLTKQYFATPSEDMFQVRDVGTITFTYNTCADGYNMEQCVDIKTTTEPILIAHNIFDGATLHQVGHGEDGAGGCIVIHESDMVADTHRIEYNYFRRCRDTVIRFAPGGDNTRSSANVRYNVLLQPQNTPAVIPIEVATNITFAHNTMLYGTLKLGNSTQDYQPEDLHVFNNIFYRTIIEDNMSSDVPYSCDHNLFYQLAGTGFSGTRCDASVTGDPSFVDTAVDNLFLRPSSPAIGRGRDGTTLGAMPVDHTATGAIYHLFLPLLHNEGAIMTHNFTREDY